MGVALAWGSTGSLAQTEAGWPAGKSPALGPPLQRVGQALREMVVGSADLSPEELLAASRSSDPAEVRKLAGPNGERLVTLHWESFDGEQVGFHTTQLVIAENPEPGLPFLVACAGSMLMLIRRRPAPSPELQVQREEAARRHRPSPHVRHRERLAPPDRRRLPICLGVSSPRPTPRVG